MEVGVKGYQEASGNIPAEGELRYIQMSVERETQKVQIVLVWNVFTFKEAEQTLPRLVKRLKGRPDLWHSVYVNFQTSASNVILNYNAKAWKLLWGPPSLKEKIGNANFFFAPQIFRQVNHFYMFLFFYFFNFFNLFFFYFFSFLLFTFHTFYDLFFFIF